MDKTTLQVRISYKTNEAADICSFELTSLDGKDLPPFSAGAHIDVHIHDGLVRQYSLCNHPGERHRYVIAVLRDPASRGGSATLYDKVKEGDTISISAPRNHFPLALGARKSLLLAGGIGVTPILSMAKQLWSTGADFEMHYCTRSRERTAFLEWLQASEFSSKVNFHFDDVAAGQKPDIPMLLAAPEPGTHLYVCGPSGFLDTVTATARSAGWLEENIHFEYFSAVVQTSESDAAFQIKIASSSAMIPVAADQTVASVLMEHGFEISLSCEQGICGSCITRVLEGEPEHRDQVLTDEERVANDQFTPCCSRSKTPVLVLDL